VKLHAMSYVRRQRNRHLAQAACDSKPTPSEKAYRLQGGGRQEISTNTAARLVLAQCVVWLALGSGDQCVSPSIRAAGPTLNRLVATPLSIHSYSSFLDANSAWAVARGDHRADKRCSSCGTRGPRGPRASDSVSQRDAHRARASQPRPSTWVAHKHLGCRMVAERRPGGRSNGRNPCK
jgi:hypothetical protein